MIQTLSHFIQEQQMYGTLYLGNCFTYATSHIFKD